MTMKFERQTFVDREARTANSRFAKAGVSYFYDSKVLNSNFVHLMKFCAEIPRPRKAPKRCATFKKNQNTLEID